MLETLTIPEVKLITPRIFGDDRGFFSETYNRRALGAEGLSEAFVQDNHSLSAQKGTLRGLHFQIPPEPQGKLVRVTRGSIYDVAVDIRHGSPTFGKHVGVQLSAENWQQLYIPVGFAHGFCTLEDNTEVLYKTTGYYSRECDVGIRWNDPAFDIEWPVTEEDVVLSEKDASAPFLAGLPQHFTY